MPKTFHIQHLHSSCDKPNVVVAMAVYGQDKAVWLDEAISSILTQTYTQFVFAIVIDGPVGQEITDTVYKHAANDNRIMVVENVLNQGLSRAMNFIIDWCLSSCPDYFFRMDADDVSTPERLETQINYLESNPDIHVLGSALTEIDENGREVGIRKLPFSDDDIKRMLPKRCSLNHPTVCLRFSVFKKGFRYNDDLLNTQDYFLWSELAQAGYRFTNLSEPLLNFRRVGNFYKRRGLSKSINEFKARLYAMKLLKRLRLRYLVYASAVLCLRLMPPFVVKFAYKVDRFFLNL